MLENKRTDASEGTDVNKISGSHEYIICHYWYIPEINFRFQLKVCTGCHDLMQRAMSFNHVPFVSVSIVLMMLQLNSSLVYE